MPYADVWKGNRVTLRRELDRFDLGKNRRISFYSIGAAYALLLDSARPGWKDMYESTPFVMTALLKPGD